MLKFTMFRRFFLLLLPLFLIPFLFLASPTLAQAQKNVLRDKQQAIEAGGNQEAWIHEALNSNMVSALITLVGPIPDEVLEGTPTSWIPGGALGSVNKLVAATLSPPASGIEYLAQVKDNFLGKPAYAQGVGFKGLQPILPLWRGFRNVVYILSSIIFVIIGLMIILRVKISPQAVISIQNAIPNIITTLILVTFSYAIAGLLIDLLNLFQAIALSILFSSKGIDLSNPIVSRDGLQKVFDYFGMSGDGAFPEASVGVGGHGISIGFPVGTNKAWNFADLMNHNGFLQTLTLSARALKVPDLMGVAFISNLLGLILAPITGGLSLGIGSVVSTISLIIILVLVIVILINMFKLFFGLLKCYINVIIKIILGPLEIGLGAFPNSKTGFNTWLWELIANLAVFPCIVLFLVLLNLIVDGVSTDMWRPSVLGIGGTVLSPLLPFLVGFAGFMLLAKLPEMIPQFIFMIKPSPWGQAIGQGLQTPKWIQQGQQLAVGTAASMTANKLTAPTIDPVTGNVTAAKLTGWKAAGVNTVAGFFGGKPRGA